MSRMFAGFSSMLLLSLFGSIASHTDLAGAVSLLSVPDESNMWNNQLRGTEIAAKFGVPNPDTPWKIFEDDYIFVPDTGRTREDSTRIDITEEAVKYTVHAAFKGEFVLECEVLTPKNDADSFHVWFDKDIDHFDSGDAVWYTGIHTSFTWVDVASFWLDAGPHTLTVAVREEGAKLRRLRIKSGDDVFFTNVNFCPFGFFPDITTRICQDANCAIPSNADAKTGFCSDGGCSRGFFSPDATVHICKNANCAIPANADAVTGLCVCNPGGCSSGSYSSDATMQICEDANCAIPANADAATGLCSDGGCSRSFFSPIPVDICQACRDPNCVVCPGNTCTTCSRGYILNVAGTCVSHCPKGQYGEVNTDTQCTACRETNCAVCPGNTCTKCSAGLILNVAGTCVSRCPSGQYGEVNMDPQCKACGETNCVVCPGNTCTTCSRGSFLNAKSQCIDCAEKCDVCTGGTCTKCSSWYILNVAGVCVGSCPKGQFGRLNIDSMCKDLPKELSTLSPTDQYLLFQECPAVEFYLYNGMRGDIPWDDWCYDFFDPLGGCQSNGWMLHKCTRGF